MKLLEQVADEQRRNPSSFDIRWHAPGIDDLDHIRLGWDGGILSLRILPASLRAMAARVATLQPNNGPGARACRIQPRS